MHEQPKRRFYLLIYEAATGIVLMQDCMTRFHNHTGTTAVPYIELDVSDEGAARRRATGILIMYPKVEVTIYDEHMRYITTLPNAN
ncbi:hypothetical protein Hsw_2347 [Hymenobacter swuensis DY53]|uniref:Uncharacterized protein n=2 Tax=Hymenobacter TaxID=89966 RepID=W8F1S5_9BACT|nr:hypothetical protein Hsw_2347 [Hymenobacter swuensis DY53]